MWFKRVLLGYCAASLAVTIVTASVTKDATIPRRQHNVEKLIFPSLERRQQPFKNVTSLSKSIELTTSVAATSSILTIPESSQSTTFNTPSPVITLESTFSPTLTPDETDLSSLLSKSSSGDEVPSTSTFLETQGGKSSSASSATGQPSFESSATSQPILSQLTTSEQATSSTIIITASSTSSFTNAPSSSSTLEISSSTSISTSYQSSTTSVEAVSSTDTIHVPSPTSISVTLVESSQAPPDTITLSLSESVTSSAAVESKSSTMLISSLQTSALDMSSLIPSTSTGLTSQSIPTSTTPIEQQTIALSTSPSAFTSDQIPSSGIPEQTTSIPFETSTSLLPSLPSTSLSGQASESTFLPALSSTGGFEASSSSVGETLSTSALEATSMAATSTEEIGSSVQVISTSLVLSSLVSSAIEPSPTSILETITSIVESSLPSPSPSNPETAVTLTTSAIQPSLSLGSVQSLPGSFTESTSVISDVLSTSVPSSQPIAIISSTSVQNSMVSMVSSTAQVPTSSLLESTPVTSDVSSTSSFSVSPSDPIATTGVTSGAESNFATATSSLIIIMPTQSGTLFSETRAPISSTSGIVSTNLISFASASVSPVATLSPTVESPISSSTLEATWSRTVATGLSSSTELPVFTLETSVFSSTTYSSEIISSFVPSETRFSSVSVTTTFTSQTLIDTSQSLSSPPSKTVGTQPSFSGQSSSSTFGMQHSVSSIIPASESQAAHNETSSILEPSTTGVSSFPVLTSITSISQSLVSGSQALSSQGPTSVDASSLKTTATSPIPISESSPSSSGLASNSASSRPDSLAVSTPSGVPSVLSSGTRTTMSSSESPLPPVGSSTQTANFTAVPSGAVTATFSTVYVSSIRSSAFDLSTVAFSLLNSVTGAAVNQTDSPVSTTRPIILTSVTSGTWVPASESLQSSGRPSFGTNSTSSPPAQSSSRAGTGLPGTPLNSTISRTELGITFSLSALPTGTISGTASAPNVTQAETAQTSSKVDPANSSTANSTAPITSGSGSSMETDIPSSTSASGSETTSTTEGADNGNKNTLVVLLPPTSTPSQTAAAGSPPPLTTSQTAGIAVGGTTCLLIAVVAAVFIARRYHAAKHGKHMSAGSVYPKVAYLYDPKTGGGDGDAEALMSGVDGSMPPGGSASRAIQGFSKHIQRHSTGTTPLNRFTSPGNPFSDSERDPAIHRYSEYARRDTARALSAAVAGYAHAPRHSSSYTRYQSNGSNPFSDHVIPSPTFAPFSPDDIRRPGLETPGSTSDDRCDYSQMSINPHAYLNTAASMYPPISPYGRPSTHGPSPTFDTRRQTMDSDPFADPFEHDLLLQVDERNRTSDSVTIFAPSPNLMSPRAPRTPVGPKLPVRQPSGMTSARSLLSPVAAKYMHKAQKVKIPRKSIASPVLVQVGRSPVIKPFSPPPAAPEPLGWEDIKRHSEKRFSDEKSVPAPLKFASPIIKKKPAPLSHIRTKPSLTGAGQALLAGNGLPLTVNIPHMYNKSVGLDVPRLHGNPHLAQEDVSNDPVVREKRSRELRFADPALIGKEF